MPSFKHLNLELQKGADGVYHCADNIVLLGLFDYLKLLSASIHSTDLIIYLWCVLNCFYSSTECFLCVTHVPVTVVRLQPVQ